MGARVKKLFEVKMAEKQACGTQDGSPSFGVNDSPKEVNTQTSKRCSSESYCSAPPIKSPRADSPSATAQTTDAGEEQSERNKQDIPTENVGEPSVPSQRKSWRRATITRRSLPAPPNPLQALSRSISTSLPQEERLEKLLEAAVKWALERTQNSLQSVPNSSIETFQKQVKHIHKEWSGLAKSIYDELQVPSSSTSVTEVKRVLENVQKATNRLNEENQSWEALLSKHRNKAEELNRMVEKGQKTGIPLDSAAMAQSSVYHVIQNKPNYCDILCRQRHMLHTIEMIMETQCKMVRELISIKEMSHLLLKEASGRLAEEAGFQALPTDILKNLMSAPSSTAST